MAGEEAVMSLAKTAPVSGIAKLDRAVLAECEEGTTVGTKPAGRLVQHRLTDRPPVGRVPELSVMVATPRAGPAHPAGIRFA